MDEVVLNDYSLLMNLTIRNLEQRDFGGYQCKSSNALGRAEGTVRLQGKPISHYSTPHIVRYTRKPFEKQTTNSAFPNPQTSDSVRLHLILLQAGRS